MKSEKLNQNEWIIDVSATWLDVWTHVWTLVDVSRARCYISVCTLRQILCQYIDCFIFFLFVYCLSEIFDTFVALRLKILMLAVFKPRDFLFFQLKTFFPRKIIQWTHRISFNLFLPELLQLRRKWKLNLILRWYRSLKHLNEINLFIS